MLKKISLVRKLKNNIFTLFCILTAIISVFILCSVLFQLVKNGIHSLNIDIFLNDTRNLGLRNAIIGSFLMTFFAILISAPFAILVATFLVDYNGATKLKNIIRFLNDILLSTPSVITGLFIYTLVVVNTQFSGWAGILALSVIAFPMIVRTSEDVLFLVSPILKEAAIALGIPKYKVIISIVYRSAIQGLITGTILATARIMGESAPLLFTSAKNSFLSFNLNEPIESLPVMIYENALQPYEELQNLAWTGALIITCMVLIMNLTARYFAKNKSYKL